jgi:hypothetical protein
MPLVNIPGYDSINFPDSMTDEEIEATIPRLMSEGQIRPIDTDQEEMSSQTQPPNRLQDFLNAAANNPVTNFAIGAGDQFMNSMGNVADLFVPNSQQQLKFPKRQFGEGDAYDYGKVAGEIGSFGLLGGAGGTALKAAESLPYVGRLAAGLGGAAPAGTAGVPLSETGATGLSMALGGPQGIARRALGASAYGASQDEEDRLRGAEQMGLASLGADALLGGAGKLLPHKHFAGNYPTEQLLENLRLTKGTETGLGDILGSPRLQRTLENKLTKIPFSGAEDASANVAHDLNTKANVIMSDLSHGVPEKQISSEIGNDLRNAHKMQRNIKNKLYQAPQERAEELGYKVNASSLGKEASKYLDVIEKNNILDLFPEERDLIKRTINLKEGLMPKKKSGFFKMLDRDNENLLDLKQANILKSTLNDESRKYLASNNPMDIKKGDILSRFSRALDNDINKSLDMFSKYGGHPEIKEGMLAANKNYAENYSGFMDKDVYKFLGGNQSPEEIISTFIKTGIGSDKSDQVKKLMKVLPKRTQDLVKYSYLSRAIENGKLDPSKLKTLFGKQKLGPNQMEVLFNRPGEAKKMYDFMELAKLNSAPLNRMLNPKTGQMGSDKLVPYMATGLGAALATALGGGALGALGGGAAVLGGANLITKALTNEKVREMMVNAIISEKKRGGAIRPSVRKAHKGLTVSLGKLAAEDYEEKKDEFKDRLFR